jgi:hypothetical protein
MVSGAACSGATSCCWDGCAYDEDGRASCSCWAATVLPAMRVRILRRASMSCAEAPQPLEADLEHPRGGVLDLRSGPASVPAEGWMAEAEGLTGSGASGGVDA